jgi:hypothetical protein
MATIASASTAAFIPCLIFRATAMFCAWTSPASRPSRLTAWTVAIVSTTLSSPSATTWATASRSASVDRLAIR